MRRHRKTIITVALGAITFYLTMSDCSVAQDSSTIPRAISQESSSTLTFPSSYLLGSGDQLSITVLGYEEYTNETYTILPDGTITFPLIGSIAVDSLSIPALQQEITTRLDEYLVDPEITITLTSLRPVVVTISGEVMRPGPLQLGNTDNNFGGEMPTVSIALLEAGGITSDADIQQIIIRRPTENGELAKTTVNLWDALVSGNPLQDLILQDGDSIWVPELPESSEVNRRLLTDSTLAPTAIPVRVIGEVNAPGEVEVPPNSTISSAIAIAGGPTEDAQLSHTSLVRLDDQGSVNREVIDLRELADEYQIQEGDIVYVPKQDLRETIDLTERILNPLGTLLNLIFNIF